MPINTRFFHSQKSLPIKILYNDFTTQPIVCQHNICQILSKQGAFICLENALNEITNKINIYRMSYKDDYIDEIDNEEDYNRVSSEIKEFDYKEQNI